MGLLGSLFGKGTSRTTLAAPARQRGARPAVDESRTVRVRLEVAQLLLRSGSQDVYAEGPIGVVHTPGGVLVTPTAQMADGPPPICRLEVPDGTTVELDLARGGLTVRGFNGTLRARIQSGSVSIQESEGQFRVVVPDSRVDLNRVRGEIDILTTNGMVTARQIEGGIQVVSNGGAIDFENIDGPIVARTINGSIDAVDLRGTTRLSTRTGEVRISGACGQLTVRTQSGDVTLDCSVMAHTTLETFKGNLDLKLGPLTNTHLEAKVGQGTVRAERISPLPGSSRRTLRSTLGLGESRLRLASSMGLINVSGPPRAARTTHGASPR